MEPALCCPLAFFLLLHGGVGWAALAGGCALYNRLVGQGSPERVRQPGFGRTTVALLGALAAWAVVGVIVHGVGGALGRALGADPESLGVALLLQTAALGLVALGAVLAVTLPTTFARGLLVALSVVLLVAGILAAIAAFFGVLIGLAVLLT
jgi:hypothetical protein